MPAYYNEIDPKAAAWLRELIRCGHIAPGDVDERSIAEVSPDDLRSYTQCHFFAGIGVWSYALRCAGWPDDRPVWTGSCPCQPFSTAGKRRGHEDERHLWPVWFRLIGERRPVCVFGEQVANGDGSAWLDHVASDLESLAYAIGAVSAPACGFGAPHIRQRLYWVANSDGGNPGSEREQRGGKQRQQPQNGGVVQLADAQGGDGRLLLQQRRSRQGCAESERRREARDAVGLSERDGSQGCSAPDVSGKRGGYEGRATGCTSGASARALGHAELSAQERQREHSGQVVSEQEAERFGLPGATNGFWRDAEWLACTDGKARPVEPGTFPLAHGAAARVGRLRGYGNAIVAAQAQAFIEAFTQTSRDRKREHGGMRVTARINLESVAVAVPSSFALEGAMTTGPDA